MVAGARKLGNDEPGTTQCRLPGVGVIADRVGSRKRLLMGLAEGGVMPVSQSLIATEVDVRHRGLAMGVAQGFGSSLMGSFVAPVMLVTFATAFGWRHAFFLAGVPGLLMA